MGDTAAAITDFNDLPKVISLVDVNGNTYTLSNPLPISLASAPATVSTKAQTTSAGGTKDFHLVSAASNNATNIKATAGQIYGYEIYNTNAAVRYVKIYNKATAPAPAGDTPFRTIGVPPGGRAFFHSSTGLACNTGIGIATVTGISDSDNTSVGAADLVIDIDWI